MHPEKDNASHFYEQLLFVFRNAAAFLPAAMIPLGILSRQGLADSRFYTGDGTFIIITAAYITTSVLYLLFKKYPGRIQSPIIDVLFSIVFHALTILFVLFVSGFLSAFLAVWIVLMIYSDIRFGIKGFIASFLGLSVAGWLSAVMHAKLTGGEQAEILQGVVVVGAIGFIIARIRALTDRERNALAKTRDQEAYQRERLIALVNSMGDGVIATDEQGAIKVYNSTLLSLLDTNLDLANKSISDVLKLQDKDQQPIDLLTEARNRKGTFSRSDLSYKFADGEVMNLYVNVAPIQPGYQSLAERGYIVIMRDITKEKTLEEERDEFVSVVSHELRTPVTIAEGNLSNIQLLFQRGADKAALNAAVADAHEQIIYLAKLVNDLSTLARAERGTAGKVERVDLTTLLNDTYTTYTAQAQAKKLQFNLDVTPKLPKVSTNPLYLQEVLQNLITNAIKYTQQGSVTLRASSDSSGVSLEVADTGIGISKSDQQHIFEKFYRSEDYRTRESSGTGLGLYVCIKLAEKLGYKLTFESRLNHGTTFKVLIPTKLVMSEAGPKEPQPEVVAEDAVPDSKHSVPSS